MERRHVMLALASAALPLAAGRLATAQPSGAAEAAPTPITRAEYVRSTSQLGYVARVTSVLTTGRSKRKPIRRFGEFEVIEQRAAAQALTSNANPPPPAITAAQRAQINALKQLSGDPFDAAYVALQVQGHEQLLVLQNRLLATDTDFRDDIVHIALLLRSNIEQHLIILFDLATTGQL